MVFLIKQFVHPYVNILFYTIITVFCINYNKINYSQSKLVSFLTYHILIVSMNILLAFTTNAFRAALPCDSDSSLSIFFARQNEISINFRICFLYIYTKLQPGSWKQALIIGNTPAKGTTKYKLGNIKTECTNRKRKVQIES